MSDYAILIPARQASTRLPGKMLLAETGRPLILHVLDRAREAPEASRVIVVTDDERILQVVEGDGGEAWMTRADHVSGTDRCAEAAARLSEEVVVNVQGDEPLFAPGDLPRVAAAVAEGADIATLGYPFESDEHREDPAAVKAVVGPGGWAVGFQRAWPDEGGAGVLHHIGIYGFARDRLLEFPALARTAGERQERLEQLRALEHGWRIQVLRASAPAFGVDTRADYERFMALCGRGADDAGDGGGLR